MNTEITPKVVVYKGIEILVIREGDKNNGRYVFTFNDVEYGNTNLLFAKKMITRLTSN